MGRCKNPIRDSLRREVLRELINLVPHKISDSLAETAGICPRTARKWVARYRAEGTPGLSDRSSRPKRLYRSTPQAIVERIETLRRHRLTGKAIAVEVGVCPAATSRFCQDQKRLSATELPMFYCFALGGKFVAR